MAQFEPFETRFWSRIQPSAGCWLWMGVRDPRGYGFIKDHQRGRRVHRVMWELLHGPIPDRMEVCHHCDNPSCVRPDHLFVGTHTDNMRDMFTKNRRQTTPAIGRGRHAVGEAHWYSKLTAEKVREIRSRVAAGEAQNAIAAELGLSTGCISGVVHRRTWRHVA